MNAIQSIRKTLGLSVLFATAALAVSAPSQAGSLDPLVEKKLIKVCEAIKADNKLALHKAVKATGVSYRELDKGLVCNGQDMMTFAATHGAKGAGAFIAKRTGQVDRTLTAKR